MSHENDICVQESPVNPSWDSIIRAEEELLARAREVAQEITQRVQKALGGTEPHAPLPTEPTKENPPLA
jgi:hypothetical protein